MSRHVYGQGNGPTRARTLRENLRSARYVRTLDDRDVGVRQGLSDLFGFGDERGWVDKWTKLAHRWLTKGVCK